MAEIGAKYSLIPVFIDSESKEELIKKMFLTNQLNGKKYNYMQPMKEGNSWVVWFYADIENYKTVDGLTEEEIDVVKGMRD